MDDTLLEFRGVRSSSRLHKGTSRVVNYEEPKDNEHRIKFELDYTERMGDDAEAAKRIARGILAKIFGRNKSCGEFTCQLPQIL